VISQTLRRCAKGLLPPKLGVLVQYAPRPMPSFRKYQTATVPLDFPKISIVTPSYMQAQFIGRTIESVLSQQYPNLEYIIQDGGSTDGTVDLLRSYENKISSWASSPDNGQSEALNLGFSKSTGSIMAYLNSDDLILPGCLACVGSYFNENPSVDVVYGHRIVIDSFDQEIGRWVLPNHDAEVLRWADYIPQETLFWRRKIWDKAGGRIDDTFRFAMDWDLLLRFQDAGANIVRLDRFLGAFRVHAAQKTSSIITAVGHEEMKRLRERIHGKPVSHEDIRRKIEPYLVKATVLYHLRRLHSPDV
jgi:glycosyltransferase involved in cell wall biosynthesis